ncbi:MAG: SPOR domain-containing protein [Sphingomonas bacterium]|nr:SPOR domain-containing protein [Sphingomonas bacterium]
MHKSRPVFPAAAMMRRAVVLLGIALLPAPALAQYIGGAPPPLPAPLRQGEVETPAGALARAVRMLARSPRDFGALITAGRAAVDLGDTQAAIGFFGRAEEVRPSDPGPKIGMGAATVATGDADGALRWFFEAQRLGATGATLGAERGLAQDLLGNQSAAQVDYRAALGGREADEARRRLALSLGISGNRTAAFTALQPLLARRDPAAQRVRAFVLALVGDERGASSAIDQAMPGTGSRMAGFFRLLPRLSAPQKAAAVHLGVFPDPSEIRVAAVSPRIIAAPAVPRREPRIVPSPARPAPTAGPPTPRVAAPGPTERFAGSSFEIRRRSVTPRAAPKVADPTPLPLPPPVAVRVVAAPQPAVSQPAAALVTSVTLDSPVTSPQPGFSTVATTTAAAEPLAPPPVTPDASAIALPEATVASAADPAPTVPSESASSIVAVSGDRLSGIDRLLAQADELPVPPAPTPRFEEPVEPATVAPAKIKKAVDAKKAAEAKKTADAKKAAEVKRAAEEEERESIGLTGTNWVQLASGSYRDRMAAEFRRLGAKSSALRRRGGAVTSGKDYFRLLTGPFASQSAAQDFVNQLAKDGVDGFSWTRTPATLRIEKIAPK